MKKLILAALALASVPMSAFAVAGTQTLINSTGLSFSTGISQNLLQYGSPQGIADNLAVQVTYSSANIASQSFTGGQQSTGSITVVSTQALVAAQATDTLVIPSTASILGSPATDYITVIATTGLLGVQASFSTTLTNYAGIALSSPSIVLDGQHIFTYGGNWASTDTLNHAAATLAAAINAGTTFTAVANSAQVTITYVAYGTSPNGVSVTSSSGTDIPGGSWAGGLNPVTITVNNTFQTFLFTYGVNWPSTDTVTHAAATLATSIDSIGDVPNNGTLGGIVASNVAGVVSSTAELNGIYANSFTLSTSSSALVSISSANFSGGLNRSLLNAKFLINGVGYENGKHWSDSSNTSTGTIASILSFVNGISTQTASCNSGINDLTASWSAAQTITFTQAIACSAGNAMTLTVTSGSGLSAGTPTFTGGQDNASVTINGTILQYPTAWNLGTSSTTTSTGLSIAASINANSVTNKIVTATNTTNVVRSTSITNGSLSNYSLTSSTVALLVSGFSGGLNTNFSSGSANIAITAHNFPTAFPVLYSASAGGSISGLTAQTTYFAIIVDANDIQLATTSTGAVAGLGVILRTVDTATASHTYTLAPLSFTQGSAGAIWQVSNDGLNWVNYSTTSVNVPVSTYTFTPNGTVTQMQDFGNINYAFIRLNFIAPTQGGVALKVILATKD